jgi:hypothetical protein
MQSRPLITLVALALLGACGSLFQSVGDSLVGNVCDKVKQMHTTLEQKAAACPQTLATIKGAEVDEHTCLANAYDCGGADQAALDKYLTCLSGLAACAPGAESTFEQALSDCATKAAISQNCGRAITKPDGDPGT